MSWNWLTRKFICIKINPRHSLKNIPPYYILLYNKDIKRSGFEKNDRRKNMNENAKNALPEWLSALGSLKDVVADVVDDGKATILIQEGDERVAVIRKIAGKLLGKIEYEFSVMGNIPSLGRVPCRELVCKV